MMSDDPDEPLPPLGPPKLAPPPPPPPLPPTATTRDEPTSHHHSIKEPPPAKGPGHETKWKKKKGVKPGTKLNMDKTHGDWYHACKTYRRLRSKKKMTQTAFLRDEISGPKFSGTQSEQSSFGKYLKKYDAGELSASNTKRFKGAKYGDVEQKLIEFIHENYKPDECFKSWAFLQRKALEIARELGYNDGFQASNGWICNVLKRGNKAGIQLPFDDNDHHHHHHQDDPHHHHHLHHHPHGAPTPIINNMANGGDGTAAAKKPKSTHNRQVSRLVATLVASHKHVDANASTTSSLSDDDRIIGEALANGSIGGQPSSPVPKHHHHAASPPPPAVRYWQCTCGEEIEAECRFCGYCGTPQKWDCACGYANKCKFVFCGMCGEKRVKVTTTTTAMETFNFR